MQDDYYSLLSQKPGCKSGFSLVLPVLEGFFWRGLGHFTESNKTRPSSFRENFSLKTKKKKKRGASTAGAQDTHHWGDTQRHPAGCPFLKLPDQTKTFGGSLKFALWSSVAMSLDSLSCDNHYYLPPSAFQCPV